MTTYPAPSSLAIRETKVKKVISYPRLHCCLFDLGNATPRKDGGAGFTVSGLPAIIEARPSQQMGVSYSAAIDRSARNAISTAMLRLVRMKPKAAARLDILQIPPQHIGLGSKTTVILGVLKALDLACDLELTQQQLQVLSGRGGTSGIGVNTFFTGGFVVDGGHDSRRHKGLIPSRFRHNFEIPPVVYRCNIPENWCFTLLLAPGLKMQGASEYEFFQKNTPIHSGQVLRTIALAYHGLVPAVRTSDLRLLRETLDSLHKIGFKHRELIGQSAMVRTLFCVLRQRRDCAVGLSSMGPLVYAVAEVDNRPFGEFVESLCHRFNVKMLGRFSGRNLECETQ